MTKTQIITKFELFMDDTTNLSSTEESDLFDKWYNIVCNDRPWEFLKKAASGTVSTSLPYVSLPSDFSYPVSNANYTESSEEASLPVVFISKDGGTTFAPYRVVSWSDRRQYRNKDGYCYVDIVNGRLYFTLQPIAAWSYEFDYKAYPTTLASGDIPAIPTGYQDIIYHGMCSDDFVIQQSDKAKSYKAENEEKYRTLMNQMALWNANLIQQ